MDAFLIFVLAVVVVAGIIMVVARGSVAFKAKAERTFWEELAAMLAAVALILTISMAAAGQSAVN